MTTEPDPLLTPVLIQTSEIPRLVQALRVATRIIGERAEKAVPEHPIHEDLVQLTTLLRVLLKVPLPDTAGARIRSMSLVPEGEGTGWIAADGLESHKWEGKTADGHVAAGGWCAPSDQIYSLLPTDEEAKAARKARKARKKAKRRAREEALERGFTVKRGGMQFTKAADETTMAEEPMEDRLRRTWLDAYSTGFREGFERSAYIGRHGY